MPHCIIEHSPNIPPEGLLQAVFDGALHSQLFLPDGADIKVRAIAYKNFKIGDGKAVKTLICTVWQHECAP